MADIKVYNKGNYIFIEDSVSGKYIESKCKETFVTKGVLADTTYNIRTIEKDYLNQPLAEIQDESGTPYADQATWESFYQKYTAGNPPEQPTSLPSTATVVQVGALATNFTLKAANADRKALTIWNAGGKKLFVKYGATATLSDYTVMVPKDTGYVIDDYSGQVDAIGEGGITGNINVTETTN